MKCTRYLSLYRHRCYQHESRCQLWWEDHSLRGAAKGRGSMCICGGELWRRYTPLHSLWTWMTQTHQIPRMFLHWCLKDTRLDAQWAAMWHTKSSPLWNTRKLYVSISLQDHKQHSKKTSAQELVWEYSRCAPASVQMNRSRLDERGHH